MNILGFGERKRSWRKARKRGVSPIIATILLVAITVVLAAVLYVLISGLTGSTASAPISLAPAVTGTGGGGTTWYVSVGITPSSAIATSAFGLKVTTTSATQATGASTPAGCTATGTPAYVAGTTCTGPTSGWYAVLTNAAGKIVSGYSGAGTATWSASVTITGGSYTLNIISAAQYDGNGYTLAAFGTGSASVSGQVFL
jgi:archaeal type IV pilus assembly protein PilA